MPNDTYKKNQRIVFFFELIFINSIHYEILYVETVSP